VNEQILFNRPTFPAQLDMSHPLTQGLAGCWLLNDSGGLRVWDSSPYGNHLALTEFPQPVRRPFNGQNFNGSDYCYKAITSFANNNKGAIEVWFQGGTGGTFFGSADEATGTFFFSLEISTGLRALQRNNDVTDAVRGNTDIVANTMYQGILSSDGSAYTIFLNGIKENLTVQAGANNGDWLSDTNNRDNVTFGGYVRNAGLENGYTGRIYLIRLWDRPIIDNEVKRLHLAPYEMFVS